MLSPLLVINYRSHCEHFALELFSAGEMASESRWHVLWIKRKMASVIKINKNEKKMLWN